MNKRQTNQRVIQKILIVDDNNEVRKKIKDILGARLPQIKVVEAENAEAADGLVRKSTPDVMITDINLPGKGGLWLTEQTKLRHPRMPIIINSFSDNEEYRTAAFQLGASYFLSKQTNSMSSMVEIIRALPDDEF